MTREASLGLFRHGLRWVVAAIALGAAPVAVAEWVTVAKDRDREVQLDLQTVLAAEAGVKVAWGRVLLSEAEAARVGFAAVRALNRFDCQKRTFTTVKRVYLDRDGLPLRDEAIPNPEPVPVAKGSVDERLWRAVCQPTSPQALQKLAQEAISSAKSTMETGDQREKRAAAAPSSLAAAPNGGGAVQPGSLPIGVDLADPNQLPPEVAQLPLPNLLPAKPLAVPKGGGQPAAPAASTPAPGAPASPAPAAMLPPAAVPATKLAPAPAAKTVPAPQGALAPQAPPAAKPTLPASGAPKTAAKRAPEAGEQRPKPAAPQTASPQKREVATLPPPERVPRTPPKRREPPLWQFSGATGPAAWYRLDPAWQLCRTGKRQSPIVLANAVPVPIAPPLWDTEPHPVEVRRTPQGVIELLPQTPQALWWREQRWQLTRATWHHPVLHPGRAGDFLGSWVVQWESGSTQLFVELPVAASPRTTPELVRLAEQLAGGRDGLLRWDWRALLPGEARFYVYEGSEAWPPCREGVTWVVYAEGGEADPATIAPLLQPPATARPPQPRNGRLLAIGEW